MEAQFSTDRKKKNIGYMISLVSAAVNGHQPVEPTDDINFGIVYKFLKLHTLANTAFYAVEKLEHKPETELFKKWRDERNMGVHKNMIQTLEFAAFTDALKQNKIEYMPIKGFPLCELYPKPDYRMMSDVDVVVREKDMKKGGEIILGLGYTPVMVGSIHHDEYNKPPFMIIELHHDMVARDSRFFKYYEGIMDRAEKVGDYERKLSDEDFFIFVLVHLNKHFEDSGTGIRSLLDLYLLNEKSLPKLDREYVFSELEKLGLTEFYEKMTAIGRKWFSDEDYSDFSDDEIYIIRSTAFGLDEYEYKNRKGDLSEAAFLKKRLFPSYAWMKDHYPSVRRFPPVLPFAYVYRIFRGLIKNRKKIKTEIEVLNEDKK